MMFYLGTNEPSWFPRSPVPLFVSRTRLTRFKKFPKARERWALDSGSFSEITRNGSWTIGPEEYADFVRRAKTDVGKMDWAAPQDVMCEPFVLEATGGTVRGHQEQTVANFLRLRELAPDLPIIPVLQGWTLEDYFSCVDLYEQAGVSLKDERTVGLGSVCRRQATDEITRIVRELAALGLRLHGFGVKITGLRLYGGLLQSADSMAWSFQARMKEPLESCSHGKTGKGKCVVCLPYALKWREKALNQLPTWQQISLFEEVR